MLDLQPEKTPMKRPRLLVQAARFGLENYCRERDIKRLLDISSVPQIGSALRLLTQAEEEMNVQRASHGTYYSYSRHIELLTAIMAEISLISQISKSKQIT